MRKAHRGLFAVASTILIGAAAQGAAVSTTITINGSGTLSGGTNVSATGTVSLSGIGTGTVSSSFSLLTAATSGSAPLTITVTSGSPTGTITATITGSIALLAQVFAGSTSASGPATITVNSGTGGFAGTTGTFNVTAKGTGTGNNGAGSGTFNITGPGTLNIPGGGGGANTPSVTALLDAASYTKNIAQGSIFVVKGSNLSGSGYTAMSFPLPTTSGATTGNVKITFTPATGGSSTDAYLVYLYNQGGVNQLAGILPSTVATGSYNVTVTYNGSTSAAFSTQVVQRKIGLITADSTGNGLAVVQNYISASQLDIDRMTTFASGGFTFSPSRPGQVLIAWAVGMGPVTGGDNVASPGFDFTKNGVNVQVIVGGTTITPLYAGRAPGLAGADQINFQLPANIQTGCTVSFQVSVNGQLSSPTYIAIASDATSSACVLPGFTSSQLQNLDQGGSYVVGGFSLLQIAESIPSLGSGKFDSASGAFTKYTGTELAGVSQYSYQSNTIGACTVSHITVSNGQTSIGSGAVELDAGTITITGPSGSNLNATPLTETNNAYSLTIGTEGLGINIPGSANGSIVAGTYTLNGAGGKDVGKFSTSITIGAPITLNNPLPSTVVRSAGLTLSWSGGNASDPVEIIGSASTTTGTGVNTVTDSWTFICTTTAGQGTFTVPPAVLNQLPAVTLGANGVGGGSLEFASSVTPSNFTASLTAGGSIDIGLFLSFLGTGAQVSYQ